VPFAPVKVSKPLVSFSQIVLPPDTVPETVVASTEIAIGAEFTSAQLPLWTTALYCVLTVGLAFKLLLVFGIGVLVAKLSTELSHRRIVPIAPFSVKVVELSSQIVVSAAVIVPPVLSGFTVIVNTSEEPVQPLYVGITVKVVVSGVAPELVAVKEEIGDPEPLVGEKPILSPVRDQVNETPVPIVGELADNIIDGTVSPGQ
jgi:hypothetical protein